MYILKYVKDVEDRSSTLKGFNAMYVKDVKDGKRTYTHIFVHNFPNIQLIFNPQKVCIKIIIMEHLDQWKCRVSILSNKNLFTRDFSPVFSIWFRFAILALSFVNSVSITFTNFSLNIQIHCNKDILLDLENCNLGITCQCVRCGR